jgi:hypothetical protein
VLKLLFSAEIYEELADEFQAEADRKRAEKNAKKAAIRENNHKSETPELPEHTES